MTSLELADPRQSLAALVLGLPLLAALAASYRVRARSRLGYRRWARLRDSLRVAGLALLAVSAGGLYAVSIVQVPAERASVEQVMQAPSTFIIAVDMSKSMQGTRIEDAKTLVKGILDSLGGNDLVVLLGFNASVFELCSGPPQECAATVERLDTLAGGRYSAIGDAVAAAATYARTGIPGVIVVVTDGGWNYGTPVDDAVRGAVSQGLKVVLVRVGSDGRWAGTAQLAARAGADVVDSGSVDVDELREFARELALKAKIGAYLDTGYVPVETRDPRPGYLLLLLGATLMALGMGGRP